MKYGDTVAHGLGVDPHDIVDNLEAAGKEVRDRVPVRYRDATVVFPEVQDWVDGLIAAADVGVPYGPISMGPSLLLAGVPGTGKTHNVYGAVRALSVTGLRCSWRVTTAADLYAALRPRGGCDSEVEFQGFKNVTLLAVDDVGASKDSEWTEEILYRLVNYRYEWMKPTLFVTNTNPEEFRDRVGARVVSRLGEMARYVPVKGVDRRVPR